jgi:hypothetical protein
LTSDESDPSLSPSDSIAAEVRHQDEMAAALKACLNRYQTSQGVGMKLSSLKISARNPE